MFVTLFQLGKKKEGRVTCGLGGVEKKLKLVLASWMKSLGAQRGVGGFNSVKKKLHSLKKESDLGANNTEKTSNT